MRHGQNLLQPQLDGHPSRRTVLAGAAAVFAIPLIAPGHASAATGREITAGRFKVTTLSDGHLTLATTMLAPNVETALREKTMVAAGQSGAIYRSPLNVTLNRPGFVGGSDS
jgi:hypothetical protein